MVNLDIELVLAAAKKSGFENIAGGASEDSIWVGDYFMPPNNFKLSQRQYYNNIEIKPHGKNFKIEVYGWKPNTDPTVYKVTKTQLCDGKLDDFLVKFFESFDETYCNTVEFLLNPRQYLVSKSMINYC